MTHDRQRFVARPVVIAIAGWAVVGVVGGLTPAPAIASPPTLPADQIDQGRLAEPVRGVTRHGQRHTLSYHGNHPAMPRPLRPEQVRGVTPKLIGFNSRPDRATAARLEQQNAARSTTDRQSRVSPPAATLQMSDAGSVSLRFSSGPTIRNARTRAMLFTGVGPARRSFCGPMCTIDGFYAPADLNDERVLAQFEAAIGLDSGSPVLMPVGLALGQGEQPTPRTLVEMATESMRAGDVVSTVRLLEQHMVESPEDWRSARLLGVALVEAGRPADGAALVRYAYVKLPELAGEPIELAMFSATSETQARRRLRELIRETSRHANRTTGASGWVVLTALLQTDERPRAAIPNLRRAIAAGLEEPVTQAFQKALGIETPS